MGRGPELPKRARILAVAVALLAGTCAAALAQSGGNGAGQDTLRVCADPNNMPFSNSKGEGFENKLAELVASALGKKVAYVWHAQRRGFIRETLNANQCDVVMGVPKLDMLQTTQPYYRSTYVFVTRAADGLSFSSMNAPELRRLKIGVHLIGNDGINTPPAHALGDQHIVNNVVGYMVYGDYRNDSPPQRLIQAVENSEIDVAAAWGPLAGYYAKYSSVPLRVTPITDTGRYQPLAFQYSIAMGVRKQDEQLRDQLDKVISERKADIAALLDAYGVPRL